jgi:hypothetical protein
MELNHEGFRAMAVADFVVFFWGGEDKRQWRQGAGRRLTTGAAEIMRDGNARRGGTPAKKSTPLRWTADLREVTALFLCTRKGAEAQIRGEDFVVCKSFGIYGGEG